MILPNSSLSRFLDNIPELPHFISIPCAVVNWIFRRIHTNLHDSSIPERMNSGDTGCEGGNCIYYNARVDLLKRTGHMLNSASQKLLYHSDRCHYHDELKSLGVLGPPSRFVVIPFIALCVYNMFITVSVSSPDSVYLINLETTNESDSFSVNNNIVASSNAVIYTQTSQNTSNNQDSEQEATLHLRKQDLK
jgi:hypothetical protein